MAGFVVGGNGMRLRGGEEEVMENEKVVIKHNKWFKINSETMSAALLILLFMNE